MVQVIVDSNSMPSEMANMATVGELVEYIKSTIDPDTIIVSLTKDNEPLSDSDWKCALSSLRDSVLDIKTGSKTDFIKYRLESVADLVNSVEQDITHVSELFKGNKAIDANTHFTQTLENLNALVNWMYSVIAMDAELFQAEIDEFSGIVKELKYVCGQMQQQQLFQSWWALGETLERKVLPVLNTMKELGVRAGQKT
jgi:hypothetical protein